MLAMPVQALIGTHVEADEGDELDAELHCEIDRVKSAVTAPPKRPEPSDQEPVLIALDHDTANIPLRTMLDFYVLRNLQPFELRNAVVFFPPQEIAAIENVTPRRELP